MKPVTSSPSGATVANGLFAGLISLLYLVSGLPWFTVIGLGAITGSFLVGVLFKLRRRLALFLASCVGYVVFIAVIFMSNFY